MNACIQLLSDVGLQISDTEMCFGAAFMSEETLTFVPYEKLWFDEIGLRPKRGEFRSCPGLLRIGGRQVAQPTDNLGDSAGSQPVVTASNLMEARLLGHWVQEVDCGAVLEARVEEHGGLAIERCTIRSVEARGTACILRVGDFPPWVLYALDCDPGERDSRNQAGERLKGVLEVWVAGKMQARPRAALGGVNVGVPFKNFMQRLKAAASVKSEEKTPPLASDFVDRIQEDCGYEQKVVEAVFEATSDRSAAVCDQLRNLEPALWAFYVSRIKQCYGVPDGEMPLDYAGCLQLAAEKKFRKRPDALRRWTDSLDPQIYPAIVADAVRNWKRALLGVLFCCVVWLGLAVWCLIRMWRSKDEGSDILEGYKAGMVLGGALLMIPASIMGFTAWNGHRKWHTLSRVTAASISSKPPVPMQEPTISQTPEASPAPETAKVVLASGEPIVSNREALFAIGALLLGLLVLGAVGYFFFFMTATVMEVWRERQKLPPDPDVAHFWGVLAALAGIGLGLPAAMTGETGAEQIWREKLKRVYFFMTGVLPGMLVMYLGWVPLISGFHDIRRYLHQTRT